MRLGYCRVREAQPGQGLAWGPQLGRDRRHGCKWAHPFSYWERLLGWLFFWVHRLFVPGPALVEQMQSAACLREEPFSTREEGCPLAAQ